MAWQKNQGNKSLSKASSKKKIYHTRKPQHWKEKGNTKKKDGDGGYDSLPYPLLWLCQ